MNDIDIWFNSWYRLYAVGISIVALYIALVILVRVSGKRTTSQMNNFDWVISVAIGGLVSSGALFKDISVADSLIGIATLLLLQWLMTWLVKKSKSFRNVVKAKPTILLHEGKLMRDNMRKERVSDAEVYAALRKEGMNSLGDADWVILETDASFSVKAREEDASGDKNGDLLRDVKGCP